MIKREYFINVLVKIKALSKGNWGFPFIAGFIVLLFSASIVVVLESWASGTAETIANLAYFALVAGVILQLASLSRDKGKNHGASLDAAS